MNESPTDIANRALIQLGSQPIMSMDDKGDTARAVRQFYEPVKVATLRAYPWNCATREVTLAQLSEGPGNDFYKNAYALTPEILRVRVVYRKQQWATSAAHADFNIVGRTLQTNEDPPCTARVVWNVAEDQFDTLFVDAFVARLASDLAYPLHKSNTLRSEAWSLYQLKLREARDVDITEGSGEEIVSDELQRARVAGWRGALIY